MFQPSYQYVANAVRGLFGFAQVGRKKGASPTHAYAGSDDHTARKIDEDGVQVWSFATSGDVDSIAVDVDGFVYLALVSGHVYKVDPDGGEVWNVDTGRDVNAVAVDGDGNVYVGHFLDKKIVKLDSTGATLWTYPHTDYIWSVAVDPAGNVYAGDDVGRVLKVDSAGSLVWSEQPHTDKVNELETDGGGKIFTASWDNTIKGLTTLGIEDWSYTYLDGSVYGVGYHPDGFVYGAGQAGDVVKLDASTGALQWSVSPGGTVTIRSIAVDPAGFIYGGSTSDNVYKLQPSDGGLVWTFTGHTNYVNAVAVDPGTYGAFPSAWG